MQWLWMVSRSDIPAAQCITAETLFVPNAIGSAQITQSNRSYVVSRAVEDLRRRINDLAVIPSIDVWT